MRLAEQKEKSRKLLGPFFHPLPHRLFALQRLDLAILFPYGSGRSDQATRRSMKVFEYGSGAHHLSIDARWSSVQRRAR